MGWLDFWRRKKQPTAEPPDSSLSAEEIKTLKESLEKGFPCIPFIPMESLDQHMSELESADLEGFVMVKLPALYPDGSIGSLYKELSSLLRAARSFELDEEAKTYFFFGFDLPLHTPAELAGQYIDPRVFCQSQNILYNADFADDIEFLPSPYCPEIELAFIQTTQNLKLRRLNQVNLFLTGLHHPPEQSHESSQMVLSFEEWRGRRFPTAGPELAELVESYVEHLRQTVAPTEYAADNEVEPDPEDDDRQL